MRITCIFLFILATLVHHYAAFCGDRKGEYIWDGSTEFSIPTNITEFEENLESGLNQLPTNETKISLYGWVGVYTTGLDALNTAYVQGRCIGYVPYLTCANCIQNAAILLKEDCLKKSTSAILWYDDNCMVRYSNHDMIGKMQMPYKMILVKINSSSTTSNAISFNGARSGLFSLLAERATSRPGGYKMLAAGKWSDYSSNETIYGVAQCSPDLYSYQCSGCLAIVSQNLETYFYGKVGGSIVGPSCNFRYEVYPFISEIYFVDSSPPMPPPPPPPPMRTLSPPSPQLYQPPSTGRGSNKDLPLLLYIIVSFLIIYIFSII